MSLSQELEKLRELHINGDINDEEFAKGKAKLLAEDSGGAGLAPFAEEVDSVAMERETRQWALLQHLSMLAGYAVPLAGLVAPIVIWQIKKNESARHRPARQERGQLDDLAHPVPHHLHSALFRGHRHPAHHCRRGDGDRLSDHGGDQGQ